MTFFDLLFIVVFLTTIALLAWAIVGAARKRRAIAVRALRRLGILLGIYFGALVAASLLTPQEVLLVGEDRCWDDWCMAVSEVRQSHGKGRILYEVTLRISSRARRRAQRGRYTYVQLIDSHGRHYDPQPAPNVIPFDVLLKPGESRTTLRTFDLPSDARDPVLSMSHGGSFPSMIIIGDSQSLFHKPTVVQLASEAPARP